MMLFNPCSKKTEVHFAKMHHEFTMFEKVCFKIHIDVFLKCSFIALGFGL